MVPDEQNWHYNQGLRITPILFMVNLSSNSRIQLLPKVKLNNNCKKLRQFITICCILWHFMIFKKMLQIYHIL